MFFSTVVSNGSQIISSGQQFTEPSYKAEFSHCHEWNVLHWYEEEYFLSKWVPIIDWNYCNIIFVLGDLKLLIKEAFCHCLHMIETDDNREAGSSYEDREPTGQWDVLAETGLSREDILTLYSSSELGQLQGRVTQQLGGVGSTQELSISPFCHPQGWLLFRFQ